MRVDADLPIFVHGSPRGIGGTERRLAEVFRYVSSMGRTPMAVVGPAASSGLINEYSAAGAIVRSYQNEFDLLKLVRGRAPLLCLGLTAATRVMPLCVQRRVVVAHNGLGMNASGAARALRRWVYQRCSVIVTNSYAGRQQVVDELGVKPDRVRVLESALGSEWLSAPGEGVNLGRRFVMVGNSRPEKNQPMGIAAFSAARSRLPDLLLTVFTSERPVGDSGRDTGITVITGRLFTPDDADSFDVLLHPSLSESRPRVVLEAAARGLLVIAGNCGDTSLMVSAPHMIVDATSLGPLVNAIVTSSEVAPRYTRSSLRMASVEPPSIESYTTELLDVCHG